MQGLPEYRKIVYSALDELKPYIEKYSSSTSPLGNGEGQNLSAKYQQLRQHCVERLQSDLPKIMLYGVYNSGKSTLLNALMGEERAEVDDIPKTYQITSYTWNGYELLDTPGINAPIEHEEVSIDALGQCQVVIFVVSSAGSFDNEAIYNAMNDVVRRGKHLFIVLNDKEGIGLQKTELSKILQQVQKNLINAGFSPDKASEIRICPVNADWALKGRLAHDENLVKVSGIYELERLAAEEIKRVNGFHIVSDLCEHIISELSPFINKLVKLGETDTSNKLSDFFAVQKEYSEFCSILDNKVTDECASMPNVIIGCFPSMEQAAAAKTMDSDVIKEKVNAVFKNYGDMINNLFLHEVEHYKVHLSEQLQKVLDLPQVDGTAAPGMNDAMARAVSELLSQQPQAAVPENISIPNNDMCDKVDAVSSILGETSIAAMVMKLPIPVLGPVLLPLGAALIIIPKLFRAIFGKSDAELERERNEAIAEARCAAEEENARNLALWRQQLKQQCQDISAAFLREVKQKLHISLDGIFTPLLKSAETEFRNRELSGKDIIADVGHLHKITDNLNTARHELVI